MAVFAAVVQHGSMSAAARALGLTPSAVSQQVRQLEREGGVTLLHRSTRQLSLSDAGQRFFQQCQAMCAAAEQARAELQAEREAPSGELRLSATVGFARHVGPALGDWLATHPQLRLRLLVDDAPIDLIQARIDLAIRYGRLADSNWVARRLGAMAWWLCAAPAWVQAHCPQALPTHPRELSGHHWLGLLPTQAAHSSSAPPLERALLHPATGERWQPQISPQITSNNQLSLQQMCEAGLGLAWLGSLDAAQAVAQGRLLRLLPDWDMGQLDIWAVTPQRGTQPAKVRQASDALQAYWQRLGTAPAPAVV